MVFHALCAVYALIGISNVQDQWWGMQLAGQPVGYYHEQTLSRPNGSLVTKADMKMVLNRMGHKVEFDITSDTEETAGGELIAVHSTTRSSAQTMQLKAERKGANLEITTEAGGKSYTQSQPISQSLCGPAGFNRRCHLALKRPGDQVSVSLFVPELGKVATETRTLLAMQQRQGKTVRQMTDAIESVPGKQTLMMAEDGAIIERRQPFVFGDLQMTLTDRLRAQAMSSEGTLPEEMYDRTLVRSNIRLPDPRSIDRITLRITHHRPEMGWPDFHGENQEILQRTSNVLVITVRRPELVEPSPKAESTVRSSEYCSSNALIQSDDPRVLQIAREASHKRTGYGAALAFQDWVAAHMRFDPGIALASASEVAQNRRGTCAAYAVLLCALERAAGLPARVAWGYVYEEGIWGGHAWTETQIGNRWIPLDAAMYSPGPADAARFRFAVSSLQNGPANLTGAGLQLYGNIDVKVLQYTSNGRTISVPNHALPYRITGDAYSNPWLGTRICKPHRWQFSTLHAVYPDPTLVAMEGANGARITLQTESLGGNDREIGAVFAGEGMPQRWRTVHCAGHRAFRTETPTKAMIVVPVGRTAWILVSQGNYASRTLEKVASTWSLP